MKPVALKFCLDPASAEALRHEASLHDSLDQLRHQRGAKGIVRLLETYLYPELGLGRWKMRLLNALADCCILKCRRDPRDFPAAEQALYLQLDGIMDSCVQNHAANVAVLGNGDLATVWFGGTQEGIPDISVYFSRLAQGAKRWAAPIKLSDDPTRSEQLHTFLPPQDPPPQGRGSGHIVAPFSPRPATRFDKPRG